MCRRASEHHGAAEIITLLSVYCFSKEDTITAEKQNMSKPKRSARLQESLLTTNTPMWPKSHQLELREALCRSQELQEVSGAFQERFPFSVRPPAESRCQ